MNVEDFGCITQNLCYNRGVPFELGDLCREFIREDHRYCLNVVK